ncbi:hypothetical protein KOW79_017264 [Hemibagrus wyckioides]|uniref:Connective tissue growth factor n=1 Tax=Hemibagrus wyckioides TaxID=337641 RepID=A0A9D3NAW0_9TELE|nr:hypothetical protein KOW79_017264 [Hemibagrus wyckioides]
MGFSGLHHRQESGAPVTCQLCSGPCQCPFLPPTCPRGVPLVLDGCRCCQICARQEGELCSEIEVCEAQRGLECDYSASFPDGPGECVRRSTLGCEHLGRRYEEGQSFTPSCMQLCRCEGGGVTCVHLCTEHLNTPDCPHPRLVHVPGHCCRKWVCDGAGNSIVLENTAVEQAVRSWQDTSAPNGDGVSGSNCIEQSSKWSECSHSCGPGVSTRVSNRNSACQPETLTRLCMVRPCAPGQTARAMAFQKPGVCESSYRSAVPVRFKHHGCYSSRSYRPLFCGSCSDGRCCSPKRTKTTLVTFRCLRRRLVQHTVMMIKSCVCRHSCSYPNSSGRTRSWL